jgi:hypothetical protein
MNNELPKKKNFISILLAATVISLSVYAVQAQRSASSSTGPAQSWEYCAIADTSFSRTGNTIVGEAKVAYYSTSGYHVEVITEREDVGNVLSGDQPDRIVGKALVTAVAQLGSQGWEMIGHMPVIGSFRTRTDQRTALYFKRVLRK